MRLSMAGEMPSSAAMRRLERLNLARLKARRWQINPTIDRNGTDRLPRTPALIEDRQLGHQRDIYPWRIAKQKASAAEGGRLAETVVTLEQWRMMC